MTTIDQSFFKCFEIKPNDNKCKDYSCVCCEKYKICKKGKLPEITSDIILKLICIYIGYERIYIGTFELDHFKRFMLASLIDLYREMRDVNKKERLKHQVQSLFTEVGE